MHISAKKGPRSSVFVFCQAAINKFHKASIVIYTEKLEFKPTYTSLHNSKVKKVFKGGSRG